MFKPEQDIYKIFPAQASAGEGSPWTYVMQVTIPCLWQIYLCRMMTKKTLAFALGIATLVIAACSQGSNKSGEPESTSPIATTEPTPGNSLPSLSMVDVSGNSVSLESMKGKKIFVNLWASWCPPCRREMPSIEKLYQSADKNKVALVMLALDDSFEKSKDYIVSKKLDLPVYYPQDNLPELFNVQGIPTTFIFNEQGALIQRVDGSDNYDTDEYRNLLK